MEPVGACHRRPVFKLGARGCDADKAFLVHLIVPTAIVQDHHYGCAPAFALWCCPTPFNLEITVASSNKTSDQGIGPLYCRRQ
jgi:hypothetical protein